MSGGGVRDEVLSATGEGTSAGLEGDGRGSLGSSASAGVMGPGFAGLGAASGIVVGVSGWTCCLEGSAAKV